jgi:hypothetical protein
MLRVQRLLHTYQYTESRELFKRRPRTCLESQQGRQLETRDQPVEPGSDQKSASERILRLLYLSQMSNPVDQISLAYEQISARVFRDQAIKDESGPNVIDWLRRSAGCYRITGKVGSGNPP